MFNMSTGKGFKVRSLCTLCILQLFASGNVVLSFRLEGNSSTGTNKAKPQENCHRISPLLVFFG